MTEKLKQKNLNKDTPRTTDEDLLKEVMPHVIERHREKLITEDDDIVQAHTYKFDLDMRLDDIENGIDGSKHLSAKVQAEKDEISTSLSEKSLGIIDRIYEIKAVSRARILLGLKPTERELSKSKINSLGKIHERELKNVDKLTTELSEVSQQSESAKKSLKELLDKHFSSNEIKSEATRRALEEMQKELVDVRNARDIEALCDREDCLVLHTLMPKGYAPGTTFKLAPSDNSPLRYEKATAGGVKLSADIALGYDLELSCCTLRQAKSDAIWPGAGGFIISEGSVRMAASCDMATTVNKTTGRREHHSVSGEAWRMGRKDNYVRTEEDLHIAVTSANRELSGNHNELIVESPEVNAVFLNIADNGRVVFWNDQMGDEFVTDYKGYSPDPYLAESTFQDLMEIAMQNDLPVYGIYQGHAYKVGPTVQRIETKSHLSSNRLPFREITLIPGAVPFDEIRHAEARVSKEKQLAARNRIPEDVFK